MVECSLNLWSKKWGAHLRKKWVRQTWEELFLKHLFLEKWRYDEMGWRTWNTKHSTWAQSLALAENCLPYIHWVLTEGRGLMTLHSQGKDEEQKVHTRNHYRKKIKDWSPTVTPKAAQPLGSKSGKGFLSAFMTMRNYIPTSSMTSSS